METFTEEPYTLQKYVVVPLKEPIYGHCFAIREKWVEIAFRTKRLLLIRTPFGQEIISPKQFKKESTTFKKAFLFPDNPMKFYQRDCHFTPLEDIEKYKMDW